MAFHMFSFKMAQNITEQHNGLVLHFHLCIIRHRSRKIKLEVPLLRLQ